ncbi:hypothetical protein DNH61_08490 [Paenibacillus sambharensis]|uniref:VWFA domain-containing protein n=1 Tax=Paenibacillus sambharensis TaxID=1803190 RepID=A0A2W1LMX4_9BACL|nr:VWA domain-containing protein [Paenibacillus sambharensis]PZD96235.1 hypothetical protein DNH61_08490 [Paenibacillus sambharensis]
MGVQFDQPLALLLFIPAAVFIYWTIWSAQRLTGFRKAAAVVIRSLIVILLIMVTAGMRPYAEYEHRDIVFVSDRSASMQAGTALGEWIVSALETKDPADRAAVVSYGLQAMVERTLSAEPASTFPFRAAVNDSFSHAASGLQLGASLLQGGGRLILLSDGEDNVGDLLKQGKRLAEQGIIVDVVTYPAAERMDAAVDSLTVPASLKLGEKFTLEITVQSTISGEAELRLYEDNREKAVETVVLERGENRFALQSVATEPGIHRYRAEINAAEDEQAANNAAYAFSRVDGPPKVLIVEGQSGSSANITQALKASLIPYELILPEQLPAELADYAGYDSIILHNVPATRIAGGPMKHLETAVRDYGIGLMMLGGEDSYGLGGYFKTPVERALPVHMELQGRRQLPSLALILVIDKSGSMQGGNMELAKEAALRTVELMRDQDTVGVVAFDGSPWWVIEPVKLTERDAVNNAIQGIQADGGTEIYPAVSTALNRMLDVEAERKHIILLTDGQSAGNSGYQKLTNTMVEEQITMSTVAVGDGSDTALLSRLAEQAKGRYYFTNDQSTIPAIFSREAVMMSRTYIVENRFTPVLGSAGGWRYLFEGGVPAVDAYVATTAKDTAESVLVTPMGDPLLARWQFGSGRSVAWTSDAQGKWAGDWTQWPEFPEVLVQWVKWTFPQFTSDPYQISAQQSGQDTMLEFQATGASDSTIPSISSVITDELGSRLVVEPLPAGGGSYTATLPAAAPGVYMAQIREHTEDTVAGSPDDDDKAQEFESAVTTGFVVPYSPEYKLTPEDGIARLKQLAELTGGRVLAADRPEEAFGIPAESSREWLDISRLLLLASLILWLLDIAVRRLSLPWDRIGAWFALLFRRQGRLAREGPAAGTDVLARLQNSKSRSVRLPGRTEEHGRTTEAQRDTVRQQSGLHKTAQAGMPNPNPEPKSEPKSKLKPEFKPEPKPKRDSTADEPSADDKSGSSTMNRLLAAKKRGRP